MCSLNLLGFWVLNSGQRWGQSGTPVLTQKTDPRLCASCICRVSDGDTLHFALCVFTTRKPAPPDRGLHLSHPLLIYPYLEQGLAHSRRSVNICLVNEKGPRQCDRRRERALPKRLKITEGVCDTCSRHFTFIFRLLELFPL